MSTLNFTKVQVSGPSVKLHQHIKTHDHQEKQKEKISKE